MCGHQENEMIQYIYVPKMCDKGVLTTLPLPPPDSVQVRTCPYCEYHEGRGGGGMGGTRILACTPTLPCGLPSLQSPSKVRPSVHRCHPWGHRRAKQNGNTATGKQAITKDDERE